MNFYWTAYYKDGNCLNQFEGEHENRYDKIRRQELLAFSLKDKETNAPHVTIYFDRPSQRLIFRKRVQSDFDLKKGSLTPRAFIWLVGWQELVEGKNVQFLLFLYEDGTVCAMPRFRKLVDFTHRDFNLEDKLDGINNRNDD
jgi:hypothetical protein